jgi:hypothetical protein
MEPCHCHPLSTCGFYLWFSESSESPESMPRYAKICQAAGVKDGEALAERKGPMVMAEATSAG